MMFLNLWGSMVRLFDILCRVHKEMPESDLKNDLEDVLIEQFTLYPHTVNEFLMFLDSDVSQVVKDIRMAEVRNLIDKSSR